MQDAQRFDGIGARLAQRVALLIDFGDFPRCRPRLYLSDGTDRFAMQINPLGTGLERVLVADMALIPLDCGGDQIGGGGESIPFQIGGDILLQRQALARIDEKAFGICLGQLVDRILFCPVGRSCRRNGAHGLLPCRSVLRGDCAL